MKTSLMTNLALSSFITFAASSTALANDNPFSANKLDSGYQLAQVNSNGQVKCDEGKCGEGKCGGSDTKCDEGKCGEGKCGGTDTKKANEGKCGEGKCGG